MFFKTTNTHPFHTVRARHCSAVTTRMVQLPATAAIEHVAACCITRTRTRTETKPKLKRERKLEPERKRERERKLERKRKLER